MIDVRGGSRGRLLSGLFLDADEDVVLESLKQLSYCGALLEGSCDDL